MNKIPLHFKGKEALEHVMEAKRKGKAFSMEFHGEELPNHYHAIADAAKETALVLSMLWILFQTFSFFSPNTLWFFFSFTLGWMFWKAGRSAILGYARLERLHRLIEEERWEIEHHRPQEKEELKAMYAAKGFSGRLLEEAVNVLMADDNRLLQVMLEEELDLSLESYEHPLKQALWAFLGAFYTSVILFVGAWLFTWWGILSLSVVVICLTTSIISRLEKNKIIPAVIWNLACAALACAITFFIAQLLVH